MTIPTKYENGVFKPLSNVRLKEGTIVDVYVPFEPKPEKRRRSVREFGFVGMWADRDDIEDEQNTGGEARARAQHEQYRHRQLGGGSQCRGGGGRQSVELINRDEKYSL